MLPDPSNIPHCLPPEPRNVGRTHIPHRCSNRQISAFPLHTTTRNDSKIATDSTVKYSKHDIQRMYILSVSFSLLEKLENILNYEQLMRISQKTLLYPLIFVYEYDSMTI